MEILNQRRLSDISFIIDKDLNVKGGNRSFLKLIGRTDFDVNLSYILENSDVENFKFFLSNFGDAPNCRNFLGNIKLFENYISCIFTVHKDGEFFKVLIEELSYSRQLLDKALLESREFSALLQNFDTYYLIYDGAGITVKNTKDLTTVFSGRFQEFKEYFTNTFKINVHHDDTMMHQLDSMLKDIGDFVSNKYYSFLRTDKNLVTIHTLRTSTRTKSLIVGAINLNKSNEPVMNAYSESRDGLTGLYNKKAVTEIAIKKIDEEKSPCSLIILDADKFKECNDSFGHSFGDKVLVTIASCITDAIKGKGIAGRIGGDEFLIILDLVEEEDIRNITRNIRTGIQWNITNVEPDSVVTCSMGIARFPANAKNYEELFQVADKSLYLAKYRGRNCYIIYKPEIHDKILIENKQVDERISTGKFYDDNVSEKIKILEMLTKIDKNDSGQIKELLEALRAHIQISKITVYDKDFNVLYIVGVDAKDIRKEQLKNKNYFLVFNKYDFLHLNNTNILSYINGDQHNMYQDARIGSTLELLTRNDDGSPSFLICFDLYKPGRSFTRDEVTFALIVARKLSAIL